MSLLSSSWYLDALNVGLLVVGVVVLYGLGTHFVPTGADPGNWLAIANERLGRDVMAADVTYLPMFPAMLASLLSTVGTDSRLCDSGHPDDQCPGGGGLRMCQARWTWLCPGGRRSSRRRRESGEAYAWGAYPQLLATSFGLLATFLLLRYYDSIYPETCGSD